MYTRRSLLWAAGCSAARVAGGTSEEILASPNQRVGLRVSLSQLGTLRLDVSFDGRDVIGCDRLGLDLADGGPLGQHLHLTGKVLRSLDQAYALTCGKTRQVHARGHELTLFLQEAGRHGGRSLCLVLRAYDDGVAFRYRLAPPRGRVGHVIRAELTRFDFPEDYACWGANLRSFDTGHEAVFMPLRTSTSEAKSLFDLPLVCLTGRGDVTLALAEADLEAYAGLYLAPRRDGRPGVQARLSPRLDDPQVAVRLPAGSGAASPWRVVMIGDHPGRLIESNLITTLSSPTRIADPSWIRPGKAAWDWWSGKPEGVAPPHRDSDANLKHLIDFAAASQLQYLIIDAGWYADPDGDAAKVDITRSVPDIDLPMLVAYASRRGVGLFLWLNWQHIAARMDEALALYQRLGIKGIKLDYLNRDDQDMMAFYHHLLARAAACRLMVDLHGATHPTGLSRTYPNLVTQEGVLGAEHNKTSAEVTSRHNVTLAYTRMLLGPMDYTPGGFRNVTPARFVARQNAPMVQTTRGQALAMYVVYDSPLACVSDSPQAYANQPGFDFIEMVPTSWDETRVLAGQIAAFIVLARRSGDSWFIGAMTDAQARTVTVTLDFLPEGRFAARLYIDGDTPAELRIESSRPVARGGSMVLDLAANGGAAIVIRHLKP